MRELVVGTRGSALATTQTESVIASLRTLYPALELRTQRITTKGDVMRDVPLAVLGGRGVFVDAIEDALRAREIDLAVHSAKDLPSRVPPDMTVAAFLTRADPRDVLVSRAGTLQELPSGARIGTSSQRRSCQLLASRPDLRVVDLRGNVDTRLRKLDDGEYDAIVLAGAGLLRLGLGGRVTEWLSTTLMLPSPGQGALAIETRADDEALYALVRPLADPSTESALTAERAFLAQLGVGCAAAVGAFATVTDAGQLTLDAFIGTPDGRLVRGREVGNREEAVTLGNVLADRLLKSGGEAFVAESARRTEA